MTLLDDHRVLIDGAGVWEAQDLGHFEVTGPDAGAFVNRIVTIDMSKVPPGRFAHALLLRDDGSILERVTVYRFADRVMLLVDTMNREVVWQHIVALKQGNVRLRDITNDVGLVAVRGPASLERVAIMLSPMPANPGDVINARLNTVGVFAARATSDGPEGVDLFCRVADRLTLCETLRNVGILPVGTGAWELLHTEWGIPHVGSGIDPTDTPVEAGLEHLVATDKGSSFPGEKAFKSRVRTGAIKQLIGFHVDGSRRPPIDALVRVGGFEVDRVRAVTWSPRIGVIGFTAVPTSATAPGTALSIESDGSYWHGEVRARPFVSRDTPWGKG